MTPKRKNKKEVHKTPEAPHPKPVVKNWKELAAVFCLLLATVMVYSPIRGQEFVNIDDDLYVTENRMVQNGITEEGVAWAFTAFYSFNWHPLTWLSHMLDCELYGLNAGMHKATNLILHLLNALLLFLVLKKMTRTTWQSLFVMAIFALHPLHVESVAWVSERKEALAAFFFFLALFAYARYVEKPELKRYLPVMLFFAMGLLSKPMIVTLPFILLLLDFWPLNRFRPPLLSNLFLIYEKVPLFLMTLVSSVITFMAQHQGGAVLSMAVVPLELRISNAIVSYAAYILKMIVPLNLTVFYPYPETIPLWKSLGAAILLSGITLLAFMKAKKYPYAVTGWLWYLGSLVPVIGILQVGSQAMADRYTYIPLIGLFILTAFLIPELLKKWRYQREAMGLVSVILLFSLGGCTWFQVKSWESSTTLFNHAIQSTERNAFAHVNLGVAYQNTDRFDEAMLHYLKALKINPQTQKAHLYLGAIFSWRGDLDKAFFHLSEAARLHPEDAVAHADLGNLLTQKGEYRKALPHYQRALSLSPGNVNIHISAGLFYQYQGDLKQAAAHFKEALRLKPDDEEARRRLLRLDQLIRKAEPSG
jgi:tetratricopeptide (TPR) repeat protein